MIDPYSYKATLVRVIDGDTIEADIDLGFNMTCRMPVRLAHINAKEHNEAGGEDATKHLRTLLALMFNNDRGMLLKTIKPHDKYGRYLAEVYTNFTGQAVSINKQMLDDGFAVAYEGGAR